MCVRLLLVIFTITQSLIMVDKTYGDDPVKAVAKLEGPKTALPGEFVTISAKGTVGKDPQFDCFPTNKNWKASRELLTEDMFITFATMEPGDYTFVLAVSNNGTALTNFTITIGQPGPTPPPTPQTYSQALAKAYSTEPNQEHRLKFIAFYKGMLDQVDTFQGSNNDFDKLLKQSAELYLGKPGTPQALLPKTRYVIGDYFGSKFGAPNNQPLNKPLTKSVLNDTITALSSLTP